MRPKAHEATSRGETAWRRAAMMALGLALGVSGCHDGAAEAPACVAGTDGCACAGGRLCDPGLACEAGLCVAAALPDASAPDAAVVEVASGDAAVDASLSDAADATVTGCGGEVRADFCPCRQSADCASGFCLPSSQGGSVCTSTCDGTCPAVGDLSLACRFVTLPGLDPTYLCVEPSLNLCRPCTDDAECQRDAVGAIGARCVRYGEAEGSFCGVACAADEDCPAAYACREVEALETGAVVRQCVLAETDAACPCTGRSVEGAAFTRCDVGRCEGTRVCDETGLSPCRDAEGALCELAPPVTVSFDAQGGVLVGPATRTLMVGEAYGPLPEASREGHDLSGWRTAPAGGGDLVTAETVVTAREAHTLFAAWAARRYVVSFDSAGGSACAPRSVLFGAAYGAEGGLCVPTRAGYAFGGWRLGDGQGGDGGAGEAISDATLVTTARDHGLTARWTARVVVVSFDSEGGSPCERRSVTFGAPYGAEGPLCAPTRAGHVFAGWHEGDGGTGAVVTDGSIVATATDHVLHARWTSASVAVSFDAAGGSAPVPASRSVTFGAAYGALATTTRTGHGFGGWWTEPDGGGAEVTPATIVSIATDHRLFARWVPSRVTVRFDSEGGTVCESVLVTFGAAYGPLCEPERRGYTFEGWHLGDDGTGERVSDSTPVTNPSGHTVYARWAANRSALSFDSGGGSACEGRTVTFGERYGPLCAPTRPGYGFAGWYAGPLGSGDLVSETTLVTTPAPHALHARWVAESYVVTFANAGGTGCASLIVTFGAPYGAGSGGALCVPTRPGHAFAGWSLQGAVVTAATVVATAGDHSLTARWTASTYVVGFDSAGGSACPDLVVTFGAPYGPLCEPTRAGWSFAGWWTGAGAGSSQVEAATRVAMAADHVVTARWTPNTVRVTLSAEGGATPSPEVLERLFGQGYGPLPATTRNGHAFAGWWTSASGAGTLVTDATPVALAAAHMLFARWTPSRYTVAFDSAGGTPCVDLAVTFGEPYGATAGGALCTPTRLGWSFGGWLLGDSEAVTAATRVATASDHVLVARWTARAFTVTLDSAGGSACGARVVTFGATYGALCTPERRGYTFDGWRLGAGGIGEIITAATTVATASDHALRAAWVANRYAVSLDARGGATPSPQTVALSFGAPYGDLPATARAGHAFGGWWTAPTGEAGVEITPGTVLDRAEPHTLYARWVANGLTVTYDNAGGAGCGTHAVVVGQRYDRSGPLCTPSRTGYAFAGWELGAGEAVTGATVVTTTTDHALRAAWTAERYRLSFDSAGGSACPERTVTFAAPYGALCVPTRVGYAFTGWTNGADGVVTAATTVATARDHTLQALWQAEVYAVTFDAGEGTAASPPGKTVTFGEAYGPLATSARVGYTLAGWRTARDGGGDLIGPATEVGRAEPHTLYAHWAPNGYVIRFDSVGGSACLSRGVVYGDPYGALCEPSRTGYAFAGWVAQGGAPVTAATIVSTASDHQLQARWRAESWRVTFEPQGGSAPEPASALVTFASRYGPLPATSRAGHEFGGWWTTPTTGGAEVTAETEVTRAEAHTLYARWTARRYTVSYATDGGTACAPLAVTFGQPYGAGTGGDLCAPIRVGHAFAGWWSALSGGGAVTGATIVTTAGDHTLFARWTADRLTVRFDSAGGSACAPVTVTFGAPYGALCAPTRAGHAFAGWRLGGGEAVTATTTVVTPGDHMLGAVWLANGYTVTFDAQGGSAPASTSLAVAFGAPYGSLPATTRRGYAFDGWWTTPSGQPGGVAVTAATIVSIASNHQLFARWILTAVGVSAVRLHLPGASFSAPRPGTTWLRGSAGHPGPTGRARGAVHQVHFGFHPGLAR